MSDQIDGAWIEARLTGARGEKAALARAMGIDAAKLSKILKGERQIKAAEIPALLSFFESDMKPVPGFAEGVTAYHARNGGLHAINGMLARPARRPEAFIANQAAHPLDIDAGDLLIIDLGEQVTSGDVVVATAQQGAEAISFAARWAEPWLIRGDNADLHRVADDQAAAVYGPVVGVLRGVRR